MSKDVMTNNAVVIERTFNAPVAFIWQLWTEAEQFRKWYGPQGVTLPIVEMDVRVGGKRLICMEMHRPDHTMKMWFTGEYREVIENKRLVYTDSLADEHGNVVSPAAMGMPADTPATTEVTIQLEDLGSRTKMVMTHAGVSADSGGADGWEQAFAKMTTYVESACTDQSSS